MLEAKEALTEDALKLDRCRFGKFFKTGFIEDAHLSITL